MSAESVNQFADTLSKFVVVAATIIGGGWGIWQYSERLKEGRVTETLSYIANFSDDRHFEARAEISEAWFDARATLRHLETRPVSSGAEFELRKQQFVLDLVVNGMGKAPVFSSVDIVVEFFSQLEICVENQICDEETALNFFASYADQFWSLHEPYITWKRAQFNATYAEGIEYFIKRSES